MKKIYESGKVVLSSIILIVVGVALVISIIKYNKLTDYYTEKVIAVKVDEVEESYDTITWANTVQTEIYYNYIYEYEWDEETYSIKLEETEAQNLWSVFKTLFTGIGSDEKLVCHLNPEKPSEAVLETSNNILFYSVAFFFAVGIAGLEITNFILKNEIIKKGENFEIQIKELIHNCPNCKSKNIGAKEVKHLNRSKNNMVIKKVWIYCRECDWQDVRIEKEDESEIEKTGEDIIEKTGRC